MVCEKSCRDDGDDAWAYTMEMHEAIARARAQPGYPVTPSEMEEIAIAANTGNAAPVIERIIAKYRDG